MGLAGIRLPATAGGPTAGRGRLRPGLPPSVEERGIDPAEVDRPFQVAVHQVAEPGAWPTRPAFTFGPARNTGPAIPWSVPRYRLLGGAAAELAEGQQDHAVGAPRRRQFVEKRTNHPGEIRQQPRLGRQLDRVLDPGRRGRLDRSRDQLQVPRQRRGRVAAGSTRLNRGGAQVRLAICGRYDSQRTGVIWSDSLWEVLGPPASDRALRHASLRRIERLASIIGHAPSGTSPTPVLPQSSDPPAVRPDRLAPDRPSQSGRP